MTTDLFAFLSGFALKLYGGTTVAGYTRFRMDNSDDQTSLKSLRPEAETDADTTAANKWQRLIIKIRSQEPTAAMAEDFFLSSKGAVHSIDDVNEEEVSLGQSTRDVRLAVDDGHLPPPPPTRYQPAVYCPASWTSLVTLSWRFPVDLEEKLDDVGQCWSPEEDGLYVGLPPKGTGKQWRLLERRLVTQTATQLKSKWFRTDGTVAVLADPLRSYLIRNIIPPSKNWRPLYLPNGKTDEAEGNGRVRQDQSYPLHIFVIGLAFDHHWLFGKENALASRLRRRWAEYSDDGHQRRLETLARKLRALYQAHDEAVHLLERLQFNGADAAVVSAQIQRIASYREAISWTRGDYYAAGKRRLESIRSLSADWKELEALRQSQGFAATGCQLVVRKMRPTDATDAAADQLDWHEEVERQMDEARRHHQQTLTSQTDRYRHDKEQWREAKRNRSRRVDEEEKKEKRRSGESSDSADDERPKRPAVRPFDEAQTRADILRSMHQSLTPPTEKIKKLTWIDGTDTGQTIEVTDPRERKRLEAVGKCLYQLRISMNQKEAAVSDAFRLSRDLKADRIQQAFHVWIRDNPRNASLHLFYKNQPNDKKWIHLADIPIAIPSARMGFANQPEVTLKFTSNVIHPPDAELASVGSQLASAQSDGDAQPTNGSVVLKCGWGTDTQGNVQAPANLPLSVSSSQAAKESADWTGRVQLDPNDPFNAEALDHIEKMKRLERRESDGGSTGASRPIPQDPHTFCSAEEMDANRRFQLLRRRADEVKPFVHLTMVPSRPDEIPSHLTEILGTSATTVLFQEADDDGIVNPLDVLRKRGQRKWMKTCSTVADRLSCTSQKRLRLADLVMEDHIADMNSFRGQLMPIFFKAKRPLRPERKERNPMPLLAGLAVHTADPVNLRVNVIRALNLPDKIDSSDIIRPFVEVSFQRSSVRTTSGNGSSPTWNQELCLPVNFQEGARSLTYLQSIRDDIFIQLFDEVVVDILDDDRQRDERVHHRLERHWLGGLRMPFQVIFKWIKIEGTFALNIPLVPVGYRYNRLNHDGPLLTVLISIWPAVSPARAGQHNGPSLEDQHLVDYIKGWKESLVKEVAHLTAADVIQPLVVNQEASTVYVGRFLCPLDPPEELKTDSDQETLANLSQFVAAIPSVASASADNPSVLLPKIWLTCQTVLDWLIAGDEERAVLLHNYMAALGYEVYVLLGMAVPEGETAYVLYRDKTTRAMRMINPSTGLSTNVTDPTCSMQHVWVLINQNDFWVNIQSKMHPSQLQYQVNRSADWRPLFSRRFPNPRSATVQQSDQLFYPSTNADDVAQLEESIANYLKQSFAKWRKTIRTKWNRHAGQIFNQMLVRAAKGDPSPTSEQVDELLESYKVFGVPLKTTYVHLDDLGDLLYATGLHRHQGIEFALSVVVKSYPNHLLHVFVFAAYLENR